MQLKYIRSTSKANHTLQQLHRNERARFIWVEFVREQSRPRGKLRKNLNVNIVVFHYCFDQISNCLLIFTTSIYATTSESNEKVRGPLIKHLTIFVHF